MDIYIFRRRKYFLCVFINWGLDSGNTLLGGSTVESLLPPGAGALVLRSFVDTYFSGTGCFFFVAPYLPFFPLAALAAAAFSFFFLIL